MRFYGRFEGYNTNSFRKDLLSGTIVGIVAIPLGMAFAIAAGVKPEYGIYTTIIAGILISLFGGSKYQIGGPTGAFIPILFAIVMQYGYENLLIAGFLAGVILVVLGLCKLGAVITYIPKPVTIGFTSGIAVIIFIGQIANFFGLRDIEKHEDFYANIKELLAHLSTTNGYSVLTASICLFTLIIAPKYMSKIPASLVGIVVSSLIAYVCYEGQVATIASAFGSIPNTLPSFHIPELSWERIRMLLPAAFAIALLGAIESLLSAVVADGMTGSRHNSNRELVGQGIANMITPLFGGIAATGAIARTATNIKNGAVSPLSGIIHGVIVLLVLVALAPLASNIPLSSMAPILMLVAWNMSERKEFMHIVQTKTSDSVILVVTFGLTVLTDLTVAVEVGLVLAVIIFVKRMGEGLIVVKVLPDRTIKHEKVKAHMVSKEHDCPQIHIYTIEGPLFFGDATVFDKSIRSSLLKDSKILLLRMGKVPFMDTTGEAYFSSIIKDFVKTGRVALISSIQPQPLSMIKHNKLDEVIGEEHFFDHTGMAISHALQQLDNDKCRGCKHFAFRECTYLSMGQTAEKKAY
ncbi:SulP family inorganic anion transporter [Paenibacillus agricola]|uniref:Sulfate permease n=1 Tax=Paenibacillus agricola TaxID=2716264 RepID=A0ABX0J1F0_9BACL|nr:sulfate permease [Paenibacillus agricola]NHN28618.1 sulfate permease [Paenibacillus agricola]